MPFKHGHKLRLKHGHAGRKKESPEYRSWHAMRSRCRDENLKAYNRYGGRGITVCERWNSFDNFLADMGPKPSPRHSLDRLDNDGNYQPGNVRWATRGEQANNRRNTRFLTIHGRTQSIADWARELGFSYEWLRDLVRYGDRLFAKKAKRTALTGNAAAMEA